MFAEVHLRVNGKSVPFAQMRKCSGFSNPCCIPFTNGARIDNLKPFLLKDLCIPLRPMTGNLGARIPYYILSTMRESPCFQRRLGRKDAWRNLRHDARRALSCKFRCLSEAQTRPGLNSSSLLKRLISVLSVPALPRSTCSCPAKSFISPSPHPPRHRQVWSRARRHRSLHVSCARIWSEMRACLAWSFSALLSSFFV